MNKTLNDIIKELEWIKSTIDDDCNIARINIIINKIRELIDRMDNNE